MTKLDITKSILKILKRKYFADSLGSDLFLWKKQGSVCSGAGRQVGGPWAMWTHSYGV